MIHGLETLVMLAVCFALCFLGKLAYGLFHPSTNVDRELTARDNFAFALQLGGYYLGILIAVGAPLIVLLNLASLIKRQLALRGIDLAREVVERGNVAAGIVLAGVHLANALLVLGALSGEGGVLPAAVFWLYAQALLAIALVGFMRLVRYDATAAILADNRAVALMMAGVLVAMANILRVAITGSFDGWMRGFVSATTYAIGGLVLLFASTWITDWLLLPGVTVHHEVVEQEIPNVGVGYIEGLFYVGVSLLVGWSL
ncbi:MAG: hypothetical protein DMD81_13875 [Candidatus Rokuibacteriota bacterium]|nr:MAG: hypothetical protein DMD81_13875 [Candidatus Rokubacteria bacterium]